jgi:hypothetical protein
MLKLIDDRYNNTVIYKLVCNDPAITDCYVGKTFDLKIRYSKHKFVCNTKKNQGYNYKVYRFIRANGGIDNWFMVEVANYNCANYFEAKMKELFHIEDLQPTLNTQKPSDLTDKKLYMKRYCSQNKDKINRYNKLYHEANREKFMHRKTNGISAHVADVIQCQTVHNIIDA